MKIGKMEAEREGQAIESLGTGVKRGRYYYIKC